MDPLFYCIIIFFFRYLGFSLHHHTNHIYTILYAGMVFTIIVLLSWLCSPATYYNNVDDSDDDRDSDE